MKAGEGASRFADLYEECLQALQNCATPEDVRAGLIQCADLLVEAPGGDELVAGCRRWAEPGMVADSDMLSLRDDLVPELTKAAKLLRESAEKESGSKKPWQLWK